MDRGPAAKIGGMDRQTLRDWVHRFNAAGPDGLLDNWTEGPKPRLSIEQMAELAAIVEAGPDREIDGVVRWRRVDLRGMESRRCPGAATKMQKVEGRERGLRLVIGATKCCKGCSGRKKNPGRNGRDCGRYQAELTAAN
jgi:transposase